MVIFNSYVKLPEGIMGEANPIAEYLGCTHMPPSDPIS